MVNRGRTTSAFSGYRHLILPNYVVLNESVTNQEKHLMRNISDHQSDLALMLITSHCLITPITLTLIDFLKEI